MVPVRVWFSGSPFDVNRPLLAERYTCGSKFVASLTTCDLTNATIIQWVCSVSFWNSSLCPAELALNAIT